MRSPASLAIKEAEDETQHDRLHCLIAAHPGFRLTSRDLENGFVGRPRQPVNLVRSKRLSEPLRSSPLITTATELGDQQLRIKPYGVMPGGLFAFPAGAKLASPCAGADR